MYTVFGNTDAPGSKVVPAAAAAGGASNRLGGIGGAVGAPIQFVCPFHACAGCGDEFHPSRPASYMRCHACPTTYHEACLPVDAHVHIKNVRGQAWLGSFALPAALVGCGCRLGQWVHGAAARHYRTPSFQIPVVHTCRSGVCGMGCQHTKRLTVVVSACWERQEIITCPRYHWNLPDLYRRRYRNKPAAITQQYHNNAHGIASGNRERDDGDGSGPDVDSSEGEPWGGYPVEYPSPDQYTGCGLV